MTVAGMPPADDGERLAALEQQLARLSAQVDHLYLTLGVPAPGSPVGDDPRDDPRVVRAVQDGNLIEAIKIFRELAGCGLAEAAAAVKALRP